MEVGLEGRMFTRQAQIHSTRFNIGDRSRLVEAMEDTPCCHLQDTVQPPRRHRVRQSCKELALT